MKWRPYLLLLFLSCFACWFIITEQNGFSLSLVQNPLLSKEAIQQETDLSWMKKNLSQPFVYLGKGRQTFVFASADGKSVLKFFNQKYFQNPWYVKWAEKIPFDSIQTWVRKEKKKRNLRKDFYLNSYRIAQAELKEDSGILFVHFGSGENQLPSVRIQDRKGKFYEIDLNGIPFVLQKRGIPFYQGLEEAYASEGMLGLKRILDEFLDSIATRIEKKIADGDQDVEHNWGMVENRIFHLDPGRLYFKEDLQTPAELKEEWRRATRSFHRWLKKRYPEASAYLEQRIEANCHFHEESIRPQ